MKRCLTIAVLVFTAGAAWASGGWHVIEITDRHTCYRVTTLPAGDGWRAYGPFNTFRQAGAWEWRHRDICRVMAS